MNANIAIKMLMQNASSVTPMTMGGRVRAKNNVLVRKASLSFIYLPHQCVVKGRRAKNNACCNHDFNKGFFLNTVGS